MGNARLAMLLYSLEVSIFKKLLYFYGSSVLGFVGIHKLFSGKFRSLVLGFLLSS